MNLLEKVPLRGLKATSIVGTKQAIAACLALCVSSSGFAKPGEHVRIGDTTISPSLGVASDFDSNATQANDSATAGVGLLVRPSLGVETEGSDITFNLLGQYDLRKYFAAQLKPLDRARDFKIVADLDAMKNSVVGLKFAQAAQILSDPNDSIPEDWASAADLDPNAYNARLVNRTTADLVLRFGPTLVLQGGGKFAYDDYKSPVAGDLSLTSTNRRTGYGSAGELAWTFFPRTSLVLDGEFTLYRWNNNVLDASGDGAGGLGEYVVIPNSAHLKTQAGLRGRLTERLVVIAMAGYGNGSYDEESIGLSGAEGEAALVGFDKDTKGLDQLLVSSQLRYRVGANQNVGLVYLKNFTDVHFTNYAAFHDIGLSWDGKFGERLSLLGAVRLRMEDYQGEVLRQDQLIRAGVTAGYRVLDWTHLNLSSMYLQRLSSSSTTGYGDLHVQLQANFLY
jgi:hypothetical protein